MQKSVAHEEFNSLPVANFSIQMCLCTACLLVTVVTLFSRTAKCSLLISHKVLSWIPHVYPHDLHGLTTGKGLSTSEGACNSAYACRDGKMLVVTKNRTKRMGGWQRQLCSLR